MRPLPARLVARYSREGLTTEETLAGIITRTAAWWPERAAVVDGTAGGTEITYRELLGRAKALALYLRVKGLRPGDRVLVQSPNCIEILIAGWATWLVGCVLVPVVDIYREHELRKIYASISPDVVMTSEINRGESPVVTHQLVIDDLSYKPKVKIITTGRFPDWTPFSDATIDDSRFEAAEVSPDDIAVVLFTSGTTSAPKGVLHSSRTLIADGLQGVRAWGLDYRDRGYLPLPLSHVVGIHYGYVLPAVSGCSIAISKMSTRANAADEFIRFGATWGGITPDAAALILAERHRQGRESHRLKSLVCGGTVGHSSVVSAADAAAAELGVKLNRVYGLSEFPSVTATVGGSTDAERLLTDGRPSPGVECEAVDPETRRPLAAGLVGELRVRGPERFLGYLDPEQSDEHIDKEGWFYTGDLGVVDPLGFVTVAGRIKDIISRGGEKFSAGDIEDILLGHPAVVDVAVVAMEDERYGEVPVAFLICKNDLVECPSDGEMSDYFLGRGVAPQKQPVRWCWISELPYTVTGKVQKGTLQQMLKVTLTTGIERK